MKVLIICGSESDLEIARKAEDILKKNKIAFDIRVSSAHRDPEGTRKIVKSTDADVIIAVAGLAAALPGFVASMTHKPVIGVPVGVKLGGLDALLSMMQMPSGVPVATVSIDGGKNAAILAMEILALKDENIRKKLIKYRRLK
ncbi:MAG: 5-(carboxyamino)imidazole ribonucleotide mutase [Candidatus Aenigmarchaeota archaeon]|nr:5-(carboxyamino)imidazole ribonucleotide mutase [Candidatus Aenigmarchaeota archaeon]